MESSANRATALRRSLGGSGALCNQCLGRRGGARRPHWRIFRPSDALVEHWDGTSWSVVASPNPNPQGNNSLFAITAVNANDIWAFGLQLKGPFSEHWNGTSWSIVPLPSGVSVITGATALSDGAVVAVGTGTNGSAVILHN